MFRPAAFTAPAVAGATAAALMRATAAGGRTVGAGTVMALLD